MCFAKPNSWPFMALWLAMILGFLYAFMTLAGGGVFILPVPLIAWLGLLLYGRAQKSRLVLAVILTPFILYGSFSSPASSSTCPLESRRGRFSLSRLLGSR